jgi:hypothetical protein
MMSNWSAGLLGLVCVGMTALMCRVRPTRSRI